MALSMCPEENRLMSKKKMKDYPTLKELGVRSPKQIEKYYITSMNYVDALRIIYDRPKDSFLPASRTCKFPRVARQSPGDKEEQSGVLGMHPKLRDAVEELDTILKAKATKEDITAEILHEIELLEEDIAIRSECLKVLVKKIPAIG
jgi:hypothetical protein